MQPERADMSETPEAVTMEVPIWKRRSWWQLWRPQWIKVGTERRTFSVVPGAKSSSADAPYLAEGGRWGFIGDGGSKDLDLKSFGAVPDSQ